MVWTQMVVDNVNRLTRERDMAWQNMSQVVEEHAAQKQEIRILRLALTSIANNSCCSGCQEAALVAQKALKEATRDPQGK